MYSSASENVSRIEKKYFILMTAYDGKYTYIVVFKKIRFAFK